MTRGVVNPDFVTFGPVRPFTHPIDIPDTGVSDSPLECLTVNTDWVPIVLGALKVLKRDGVWAETDEFSLLQVRGQVDNLLSRFAENCALPDPIDWEFVPNGVIAVSVTDYGFLNDGTPFGTIALWMSSGSTVDLIGRAISDATPAGGIIDRLDVFTQGIPGFNCSIWNCLDQLDNFNYGGSEFHIEYQYPSGTKQAKRIYIALAVGHAANVFVRWIYPAECLSA